MISSDTPEFAASVDPALAWRENVTIGAERDDLHEGWPLPTQVEIVTDANGTEWVESTFGLERLVSGSMVDTNSAGVRWALNRFTDLSSGDPAAIAKFVRQFGPLHLRPDGLPASVFPIDADRPYVEQAAFYIHYARLLAATLRLATAARHESAVSDADADTVLRFISVTFKPELFPDQCDAETYYDDPADAGDDPEHPWRDAASLDSPSARSAYWTLLLAPRSEESRAATRRGAVMTILNWWLAVGGVRPSVDWTSPSFRVSWTGGLWGAIGTQLMLVAQTERGPLLCAFCGGIVRRKKSGYKPRVGQRVCCGKTACRLARNRLDQREARAKKRAQAGQAQVEAPGRARRISKRGGKDRKTRPGP